VEPNPAMTQATEAMRLADTTPGRAIPVARDALRAGRRSGDTHAAALAEQAWGHSLLQGGEVNAAIGHLRRSARQAEQAGAATLASSATIKLAFALVQRGRADAGLGQIDAAVRDLNGIEQARARAQRGVIKYLVGRHEEALADLETALHELRVAGDRPHVQRALVNRGIVLAERHQFAAAIASLREAEQLATELGRHLSLGAIAQNIGYVEIRRGDVPAALAALDHAEQCMKKHGGQVALVLWDRAELLLSVGLVSEARQAAEQAVVGFEHDHRRLMVPTVRLQLAHAAFLDQDWPSAVHYARLAEREFAKQGRAEWAALARLAGLRARLAADETSRVNPRAVESMVGTLISAGWPPVRVEARLAAAEVARRRGESSRRRDYLRDVALTRRRGPAALRARGWYAEALLRLEAGDQRGADKAVRVGLHILDEHGAALGAADLRAHSAVHRRELASLGLRLALRDGRPARVLEWAERGRASRLYRRPARPPADPELATLLENLRATAREIASVSDTGGRVTARLTSRQVELERQIRDYVRLRPGSHVPPSKPVPAHAIGEALGDRALVEFVQLQGVLHVLTIADGRLRLRDLGPLEPVAYRIGQLPFALRRLANPRSRDGHTAATRLLRGTAEELDELLLRPLPEVAERPLVIVPTGVLHGVPWSRLPSCKGRPISVSPSTTLWYNIEDRQLRTPRSVTVAAGPKLLGARSEAMAVAEIHGTSALVDDRATAHAVLDRLADADLAHLAAHGRLFPDNPLFSQLLFHDGPLLVHDIEQLPRTPRTVVLAACNSGESIVCAGDELLGLAATFIASGTAHLIASVLCLPDAATAPLMIDFHRQLSRGHAPAEALAAVTAAADGEPTSIAAAAGFICLGR
jgi:tetratricopeptide (TPR) repeat protein